MASQARKVQYFHKTDNNYFDFWPNSRSFLFFFIILRKFSEINFRTINIPDFKFLGGGAKKSSPTKLFC